tara:strand:+ start:866 stop:1069 length:204 start_codon:yes stop_codon:yes gene_type:complete
MKSGRLKMCIICVEIEKDKLKFREAIRNLREMYQTIDYDHIDDVTKKVLDLEKKEREKNIQKSNVGR